METTALGTSGAAMPVSLTTTTSQASRSRALPEQGGEVRRPGLLLALDQQLDGDGGGVAAGGGEVGAHAEQVEGDVALVVDGAAGVQLGAVGTLDHGRLERRVHPELQRVDRLHVVVAVDERDRVRPASALTATRRRPRARPAVGQISTVGKPMRRSASASQAALCGDVGGVRGVGGDRRDAQPGVEVGVQVVEVGADEVALGLLVTAAAHGAPTVAPR